jgi:hypothetical protein
LGHYSKDPLNCQIAWGDEGTKMAPILQSKIV